jgi:hypothetical protein
MSVKGKHLTCQICGLAKRASELVPGELVRTSIAEQIRVSHPEWSSSGYICRTDLNRFRAAYIQSLLTQESGELSVIERDVVQSLKQHELLSVNVDADFQKKRSVGAIWSDRIASFGGSWRFIFIFPDLLPRYRAAERIPGGDLGGEMADEDAFATEQDLQDFLDLVMRHWNAVVHTLHSGGVFLPLLLEDEHGVASAARTGSNCSMTKSMAVRWCRFWR